jgi:hypothetical protein
MLFADLVPEGIAFDPNKFWTGLFTALATIVPVLCGVVVAWLNLRARQAGIDTKLDAQDVKAEERTQQIQQVKQKVEDVAVKAAVTAMTVQAIAQKTGTGNNPSK